MRPTVILAAILILLMAAVPVAADIATCHDATCRVVSGDGQERAMGTGAVFLIDQAYVYVLTNAHVATSNQLACEFWLRGFKSAALRAELTARNTEADAAILRVPVGSFGGVLPKFVPVAPRGTVLRQGTPIYSVGCSKGSWATGFKGHVLGYRGTEMYFTPPPANGRSGSAIYNEDGTMIVALLHARLEEGEGAGLAVGLEDLYRAFGMPTRATTLVRPVVDVQCPGGGCLPQILPRRRQQQQQPSPPSGGSGGWPALPPQVVPDQIDSTVNIDLSGVEGKLDTLIQMRENEAIPVPEEPEKQPEAVGVRPWMLLVAGLIAAVAACAVFYTREKE